MKEIRDKAIEEALVIFEAEKKKKKPKKGEPELEFDAEKVDLFTFKKKISLH